MNSNEEPNVNAESKIRFSKNTDEKPGDNTVKLTLPGFLFGIAGVITITALFLCLMLALATSATAKASNGSGTKKDSIIDIATAASSTSNATSSIPKLVPLTGQMDMGEDQYLRIFVDVDTRVMYVALKCEHLHAGGAGLTPLYNVDGSPRLYVGEIPY